MLLFFPTEELNLHPEDDDFLDFDTNAPNPKQPSKEKLLQTPSPIQVDEEGYNQTEKIPPAQKSLPKDRIRVDISVSLRRPGQKMDPKRIPKTCITQFSVHRKPLGYKHLDFYETAVDQAKIELLKTPPFSNLVAFQGPWMPQIEFIKPSFKIPNSKDTCVYIKSYPNLNELHLLQQSFDFGNGKVESYQKLYIILEVSIKTKFRLQKIKTEGPDDTVAHAAVDSDFNLASRTLLDNAEKVIHTMNENVTQANEDWYSALVTYREQRQICNNNLLQIQPRPYLQSLSEQEHAPALIHCTEVLHLVNNRGQVKPNLQIQIKTVGGREVFHTPDTTGTPLTTPLEGPSTFPLIPTGKEEPITTDQPPSTQTPLIGLTKEMLIDILQQAQPAQPQLPMHLRLGPKTPPPEPQTQNEPLKRRRGQSGQRADKRRQKAFQRLDMGRNHRWNHNDEFQPEHRPTSEKDNRRPSRPHSRDSHNDGHHHHYHNRDPRMYAHHRGRTGSYDSDRSHPYRPPHDRHPDRSYRPRSRTPSYDRQQPERKYRHRSDSPPAKRPRTTDPKEMKDLAKILNIAPEKMTEAYDVLSQVMQHQKNN